MRRTLTTLFQNLTPQAKLALALWLGFSFGLVLFGILLQYRSPAAFDPIGYFTLVMGLLGSEFAGQLSDTYLRRQRLRATQPEREEA